MVNKTAVGVFGRADNLITVKFVLNDEQLSLEVEPQWTLQYVLREVLGLFGTKNGCETGECGACTVLLDEKSICSCTFLIGGVAGHHVTTIEGLAVNGKPSPLQRAFVNCGAIQCGYCTPGMIMSAEALLRANPHPTRTEIIEALSGNLCRCTGYEQIIMAVEAVIRGEYQ